MTRTSGEVRVAGTGELSLAPVGTALPADTTTALPAAWKGYGYTTEDGVTITRQVTREGIMAWQSLTPVRYLMTASELTIGCTLLQSNEDVLQLWLGSSAFTGATEKKADVPIDPLDLAYALVLEWKDGALVTRFALPKVNVSETGDVTIARQAVSYPVTFAAVAPDTGTIIATYMTSDPAFGP